MHTKFQVQPVLLPPDLEDLAALAEMKVLQGNLLQAMMPSDVRGVVVRLAAKAGLADRNRGTHVIRHSVASSWIQAGATLKQIADLLSHRSIDTTSIYAKVDLRALTQVAFPWPVGREVTP